MIVTRSIESLRFESLTYEHPLWGIVLNSVDFDFPTNSVVRIKSDYGTHGASVLMLLSGIVEPALGKYFLNTTDVHSLTLEEFRPFQLNMGYLLYEGGLIHNCSLVENLELPLTYHALTSFERARLLADEYLRLFHIEEFSHLRPAMVSAKTRKLCEIARALIKKPQLLLLDDPTHTLGQEDITHLIGVLTKHREEHGLKHIFLASEDERFLSGLRHQTVNVDNKGTIV